MKARKILILLVMVIIAGNAFGSGNQQNRNNNPVIETDRNRDYATVSNTSNLFATGGRGSLTINNQASFDVIIFAGKVANNNVLGGIRAGQSRTFDLSTLSLPSKNGSFLIRAASFETYNRRNLRVTEDDVLYTGLVVYDLNNANDKTDLNIYSGINESQQEYIYVSNSSRFVLELRLDNPTGEKIATLAPLQENKRVFLIPLPQGMPYSFYPTYVYVDPSTNEIQSFSSTGEDRRWEIPTNDRVTPIVFTGPTDTSQIAYRLGFLRIKNETNDNFAFRNGGTWLADQKSQRMVATGQSSTFELPSMSGANGEDYFNLLIEFQNRTTMQIAPIKIRPGVVYDLVVTTRNGNYVYDIRETAYRDRLEDLRVSLFLGD